MNVVLINVQIRSRLDTLFQNIDLTMLALRQIAEMYRNRRCGDLDAGFVGWDMARFDWTPIALFITERVATESTVE